MASCPNDEPEEPGESVAASHLPRAEGVDGEWVVQSQEHAVLKAIRDYLDLKRGNDDGPLWLNDRTGAPLNDQALKHQVVKIGKLAGLRVSAHDFRRGLVERLQERGMSDSLIMEITGHKSHSMITRYGRRLAGATARSQYRSLMSGKRRLG